MRLSYLVILGSIIPLLFIGCQKDTTDLETKNESDERVNQANANTNSRLSYGDTLFFLKNLTGNYIIQPITKPAATGYFKAVPKGLSLDSVTGKINVTQSERGLRYKVYYVSPALTLLDSVKLVISGIDYKDAIYEIAATPNAYDTAFPIYNARPEIQLPCGDDDEDDDGDIDDDDNACVFDETDLDNDGNDDITGVIQDKLLVDIKKGTIDAEASFHAGVFGSSNPANGLTKNFTFYYRLQDASNRALNKITVQLYHYRKRSDIPQSLLNTIAERNNIAATVNSRTNNTVSGSPVLGQATEEQNFTNGLISGRLEYSYKPKRPPIIIIVSQ